MDKIAEKLLWRITHFYLYYTAEVYNKSCASQVNTMADGTVAPSFEHEQSVDKNLPAIKKN